MKKNVKDTDHMTHTEDRAVTIARELLVERYGKHEGQRLLQRFIAIRGGSTLGGERA
jgi:hypothetical protein